MNIDWPSGVITIYKTDPFMTWTGGIFYNLDTELFRRALKAQEDTVIGICFPMTHKHNTSVLLGGIEYARIIEILAPYTITFDDTGGGWVCNLTGSNNNILDRTNLSSVQVRPNNSAGLVHAPENSVNVDEIAEAVWRYTRSGPQPTFNGSLSFDDVNNSNLIGVI